jgi:hypothetical protein
MPKIWEKVMDVDYVSAEVTNLRQGGISQPGCRSGGGTQAKERLPNLSVAMSGDEHHLVSGAPKGSDVRFDRHILTTRRPAAVETVNHCDTHG